MKEDIKVSGFKITQSKLFLDISFIYDVKF